MALRGALKVLAVPEDIIEDVLLAASELVANATEHAHGPYEITLRATAKDLMCEVYDYSPEIPEIPAFPPGGLIDPDPEDRGGGLEALSARMAERGRGLYIVHRLTNGAWGFRLPGDGTKAAWMAIPSANAERYTTR